MSAQFTPGPWVAEGRFHSRDRVHVPGKGQLCRVENPWNDPAERDANAHLIAAAPELYAALNAIVHNADNDVHARFVKPALGALAKARGEA